MLIFQMQAANDNNRSAQRNELIESGFGDEIVVVAAGAKHRYRRHHRGTVRYHSLVGPLDIKRWTRKIFTLRIVSRLHARRWIESHEGSVRKFGRSFRSSNRRFGRTRSSRAKAHAVNIGLDRTTVPMEEAASAAEKSEPSSVRPQIKVRYRMAYVGTVCVTDRAGNVLCAWRYAAPAHEGPKELVSRMILDVNL